MSLIARARIARATRSLLLVLALAGPIAVATPAQPGPIDGPASSNDPYFPAQGNGGYDVEHYALDLRVVPKGKRIRGIAEIDITPKVALRSFTFDLAGYTVTAATVDGVPAAVARERRKLRITPAAPLDAGVPAAVRVEWFGTPETAARTGWLWFEAGGALVSTQTDGASTLFPANDHPSDKASIEVAITVPRGMSAVGNGLPGDADRAGGKRRRFTWSEAEPMPTYAVVVAVGRLATKQAAGPPETPVINAFPRRHAKRLSRRFARQDEIIAVLERFFGPYPYSAAGVVVLPMDGLDPLEAAGRPSFPDLGYALQSSELEQMLAHEIAHQWAGNAVAMETWRDIWLNEGFATYGELLWIAEDRGVPVGSLFDRDSDVFLYSPALDRPPGDPGPRNVFGLTVYNRGALTLEALRRTVGDDAFFGILRTWMDEHRGGNATTDEFIALAESVSGRNLDAFFQRWLYADGLPDLPAE